MRTSLLLGIWGFLCLSLPAQSVTPKRQTAGDFRLDPVLISSQFPAYGQSNQMPRYRNAPQACQLQDGSWIVAYSDDAFTLHVASIHPQGAARELFRVPQSYAFALAVQGDRFAMLSAAYKKKGYSHENEQLFFEFFTAQGKKLKRVQVTGTEKILEKKTDYRDSFNASMTPFGEGFAVFYNFFRDNGKYSSAYNRWVYISPEGAVEEYVENYNRDLRNIIGSAGELGWAVHLPTRNPRSLVMQVYDPEKYESEYDIEKYELHPIEDGQDEEQYMCNDNTMDFVFGDAVEFEGKVYVSFADAHGRKDYDAGIIEADPATGEKRVFMLPAPTGSQASPPRIGHCHGRMFVLQKELPASVAAEVAERRKTDWEYTHPERLDEVSLRSFNPSATEPFGKAFALDIDWMNQSRNESDKCVYFSMRDYNMGDAIGVRAFQGHDSVLLFDTSEGKLWAWRLSAGKGS